MRTFDMSLLKFLTQDDILYVNVVTMSVHLRLR